MKIFIYGDYQQWQKDMLIDSTADNLAFSWGVSLPDAADYSFLVWGRPEEIYLSSANMLKSVIVPYAGIPQHTLSLMKKYPHITLHNLHHNALPTAEMAFALLLTAAKSITTAHNKLARGDWSPRYQGLPNRLIAGKNALILGFGAVGGYLADMLKAMQVNVMATRFSCSQSYIENGINIYPAQQLDELLPLADMLLLTLPLTAQTKNIIDHRRINLLPDNALLMNIGRGQLVEEKALYNALLTRKLAAAALDVWYNYPRSIDSRKHTFPGNMPFHKLDNIVLSPHRGGSFANYDTELLRIKHLANLFNEYCKTGVMPNKIDLNKGY